MALTAVLSGHTHLQATENRMEGVMHLCCSVAPTKSVLSHGFRVYDDPVRLMLWDTAGQEEFDAITKAYYRGAQLCVLTFSTVDRASFLAVRHWKKKVGGTRHTSQLKDL